MSAAAEGRAPEVMSVTVDGCSEDDDVSDVDYRGVFWHAKADDQESVVAERARKNKPAPAAAANRSILFSTRDYVEASASDRS